jgi:hypothetical protein
MNIINYIPCQEYVPQFKYCAVLIFSVGFIMLSVIPYLDIRAHRICLVALLHSIISSTPHFPLNEDRNPVHWAFMFKILRISKIKISSASSLGHNSCDHIF